MAGRPQRHHVITAASSTAIAEKDHRAVQLALAGATYEQIAKEIGYTNKGAAWKAVHRLIARREISDAEAFRDMEGARLDRLQAAAWPAAMRGDVNSINACRRLIESRRRLFGLDKADELADREMRLQEVQALALVGAVTAIVQRLGLDPEDLGVREVIHAELSSVAVIEGTVVVENGAK